MSCRDVRPCEVYIPADYRERSVLNKSIGTKGNIARWDAWVPLFRSYIVEAPPPSPPFMLISAWSRHELLGAAGSVDCRLLLHVDKAWALESLCVHVVVPGKCGRRGRAGECEYPWIPSVLREEVNAPCIQPWEVRSPGIPSTVSGIWHHGTLLIICQ